MSKKFDDWSWIIIVIILMIIAYLLLKAKGHI
jgi:hypothetical protein